MLCLQKGNRERGLRTFLVCCFEVAINEITLTEPHFHSQHFRPVFGACRECTKCDLYKVEEDSRAVKEAGKRARERWMKEHPEAQGNEELSRIGL